MVARAYQPENQPEIVQSETSEKLTPQEYLRCERAATTKSEFINGELIAMAGASKRHARIAASVVVHLANQITGSSCEVLFNDIRLKINEAGDYVYPDVLVVRDGGEWEDEQFDTLLNPTIIIEVLSSSTSRSDYNDKWLRYQQMPSLSDYLLIAQTQRRVEQFTRQKENLWLYAIHTTPEARVQFDSIHCSLTLGEIYERISFEENS